MPNPIVRHRAAAVLSLLVVGAVHAAVVPSGNTHVPLDPTIFTNSQQPGVVAIDLPGVTREAAREVIAFDDDRILVAGDATATPTLLADRIALVRVKARSTPIALPGGAAAALDTTFGNGAGFVLDALDRSNVTLTLERMLLQPDGRIVLLAHAVDAVGDTSSELLLARYLADGTRDATFGSAGIVSVPLCNDCTLIQAVSFDLAMEPDGALASAASVAKLLPGGAQLREIELQLRRHHADGTPETGFGFSGVQRYDEFAGIAEGFGAGFVRIVRRGDGRIAVVNNTADPAGDHFGPPAVMLLRPDGVPDVAFGDGGSALLPAGTSAPAIVPFAMQALADGRLVVGGLAVSQDFRVRQYFAARITAAGHIDTSFADDGLALVRFRTGTTEESTGRAIAHDADGRLYVAGDTGPNFADTRIGLLRLRPDGSPDTDFAPAGRHAYSEFALSGGLTNVFESGEVVHAATVAPSGVLVAAGARTSRSSDDRSEDRMLVFRLQRELSFGDGFE